MTVTNWYGTQLLIENRTREIERDARLEASRHLGRKTPRTRRNARQR